MTAKPPNLEIEKISLPDTEVSDDSLNTNESNELSELRQLIVQPREVGRVLPAAIIELAKRDNQLAEATLPIVEENIRQSIQRNPEILTESLFPVIGPAIRKAIAETLGTMIQSLNQSIEHSFSPRGLKWRIEAWQTGKSFAEVVMLKTLIYRVEEVFLIHKETGLLLLHVSAKADLSPDADMVSAMLTAIQDFVRDSFKTSENATLDALQVNELAVWLERSTDTIVAAVIRGNAPLNLREVLENATGEIQYRQVEELKKFEGDSAKFEKSRPILEKCLRSQVNEDINRKRKIFTPFNIITAIAGILILVLGFIYIRDYLRWSSYLSRLKTEPGIVVTDARRGWFKDSIEGLRDPLALNPAEILPEYNLKTENVESNWKNYQDLDPQFIITRANKLLNPPSTIKLNFENGELIANGTAPKEWFDDFRKLAAAISGVSGYRITNQKLFELTQKIESQHILFKCKTTDYLAGQTEKIDVLRKDVENLLQTAKSEIPVQIDFLGVADPSGTEDFNLKISTARAEKILSEISDKSDIIKQSKDSFKIIGTGSNNKDSLCETHVKVLFETQ